MIGLIDLTFSTYAPTFRTSADALLGEPAYLRALPGSFLRRHLSWGKALNASAQAALPLARLDPIVRHGWAESSAGRPRWLYERLRFPTLNLIHDTFDASLLGYPIDYATYPPYAWSAEAAAELHAVAGDVPVLWIWQETGSQPPWTDALAAELRGVAEADPGASFVDLRDQWAAERFQDAVHPLPDERAPYAARHLRAILDALPAER